ncbi:MAG: hypothetical protein PHE68_04590 [Candidatus Peribacteraceae bacterium]|nr:hypothetical protein [Candidatus Peribacteraceae bacterium]
MKRRHTLRHGYVFLISILVIGAIAMATMGSLLLISIGILRSGFALEQSTQASLLAHTCAERVLLSLWNDRAYPGNEQLPFSQGECDILRIGGSGNENRSLCIEGRTGSAVRRFEIILQRILPSIKVYSWQEVDDFSLCSY